MIGFRCMGRTWTCKARGMEHIRALLLTALAFALFLMLQGFGFYLTGDGP